MMKLKSIDEIKREFIWENKYDGINVLLDEKWFFINIDMYPMFGKEYDDSVFKMSNDGGFDYETTRRDENGLTWLFKKEWFEEEFISEEWFISKEEFMI